MSSKKLFIWLLCTMAFPACGAAGPGRLANPAQPSAAADRTHGAEELAHRGKAAAASGDSVRAEQYLSLAIERGASERELLPTLLSVCLSSSRLRAALNHARPYLQKNPDDDQLRYLVASIHLSLGQEDEARGALELLLNRNPESADAHYLLGVVEANGDVDAARQHFRHYLDVAPQGRHAPEVRSRLSELLIQEQQAARRGDERVLFANRGPSEPAPAHLPEASGPTWFDVRAPRLDPIAPTNNGRQP
ncbi:MAG TPA: tetratricopeptide repeat protein [Polyangiaceae bacterium]|nr:tetratricopeptide repeat protein [Polyangiaceae bacterium]